MPYAGFEDGLYLLKQKSEDKGVDHYGILDIGNRMGLPNIRYLIDQPVVIHQTHPKITLDWLQETGTWNMLGKITDEIDAKKRIEHALENPSYNLFINNCEHFARYVATGVKESKQIQALAFFSGLATLVYLLNK